MEKIKENRKKIVGITSLIAFIIILILILTKDVIKIDSIMTDLMIDKFRNKNLTEIMKIFTFFGSAWGLIITTIILFIIAHNKKKPLLVTINLIVITLLNQVLKFIIQRSRPSDMLIEETGFSFPSGHSMVSMAYYGLIIYIIHKSDEKKWFKILTITILSILILGIGLSRIYLGVHYTTDVIGGITVSIAYLMLFIAMSYKYIK